MSEFQFEFEHEGKTVRPGQMMHVHPDYYPKAGSKGRVEKFYGDSVVLRSASGAVPTLPLHAISWEPHPLALVIEEMHAAGYRRPSRRDINLWMAAKDCARAQLASTQPSPLTGPAS